MQRTRARGGLRKLLVFLLILLLTAEPGRLAAFAGGDGQAAPDPSISMNASPSPVTAGTSLTYTVQIANTGTAEAADVEVSGSLPSELGQVEYSLDQNAWSPWPGSVMIGAVPAGGATGLYLRGSVAPSMTGDLLCSVSVRSAADANLDNNQADVSVSVVQSADLTIANSVSSGSASVGDPLTYTLSVSNSGPSDAQNVTVSDTLPGLLAGAEYSTDGGGSWSAWSGAYSAGVLAAGASVTLLTRGTVPAMAGTAENTASVSSDATDPDPGNNSAAASTTIAAPTADLSIAIAASPDPVQPGERLTYTISVNNQGPEDAQNVILTDALPSGLTGAEYSTDGGASWLAWSGSLSTGALSAGSTGSLMIRATVDGTAPRTLVNTASVSSDAADANPGNNSATASVAVTPAGPAPVPALTASATAPGPFALGQPLTVTYTLTNSGTTDLWGLSCTQTSPVPLTAPLTPDTLAAGASATGASVYTPTQADVDAGQIAFAANFAATAPGGATGGVTGTASVTVGGPVAAPGASLAIQAGPSPFTASGQTLTLTCTVTNTGNVTLSGVTVALTSPTAVNFALTPSTLPPGQTATASTAYVTTPGETASGSVTFSGAASGASPTGTAVTTGPSTASIPFQAPVVHARLYKALGQRVHNDSRDGTRERPKLATLYVPYRTKRLRLSDMELTDPRAWVFFGRGWNSLSQSTLSLEVGKNTVYVEVTPHNGNRVCYRMALWRADENGDYGEPSATPVPNTLTVLGRAVQVTVNADGGVVIPLPASVLQNATGPIAIDLSRFGANAYPVLQIPAAWFSATGHTQRFVFGSLGLLEINDGMMGGQILSGADVSILFQGRSPARLSVTQSGALLGWDSGKNPMVIGVPYALATGGNPAALWMYQDRGTAEPRRTVPRCWYSEGMMYAYVRQNGLYGVGVLEGTHLDALGNPLDDTALAMAARGLLACLPNGAHTPHRPVTRAEFLDMLMRTLDVEMTGLWLPAPPSDVADLPDSAITSVMQAIVLGVAKLDETQALSPNQPIARQEMMVLTWDAMVAMNALSTASAPPDAAAGLPPPAFPDWDQVAEAARPSIQALALAGIVSGSPLQWPNKDAPPTQAPPSGGMAYEALRPNELATQAEAFQLLAGMLRYGQVQFELSWGQLK